MLLFNQVGFRPVSFATLDRLLGVHRSTRIRCLAELKELGFVSGANNHIVLEDPIPVLERLGKAASKAKAEADEIIEHFRAPEVKPQNESPKEDSKTDYLKKATDAWNLYRPKDYQKVRRMSVPVVKAVDLHMRELGVSAHDYEEFFSVLKAGVEKSAFWSKTNSNKTLQAITGVGQPTDKKKKNVYELFNVGLEAPAEPTKEEERSDTVVYPVEYRELINEYTAAQFTYEQAYYARDIKDYHEAYVIRTEQALKDVGLDPAKFKKKSCLSSWPTDTPDPEEYREPDWLFEDEVNNGYH